MGRAKDLVRVARYAEHATTGGVSARPFPMQARRLHLQVESGKQRFEGGRQKIPFA